MFAPDQTVVRRGFGRGLILAVVCSSWCSLLAAQNFELGAKFDHDMNIAYPASHAVVDVTQAPYWAKGDGITDDTDAIQQALLDVMGKHKMLYFPNGTYLVSKTINWSNRNSDGGAAWGFNILQGQNAAKTVIRFSNLFTRLA